MHNAGIIGKIFRKIILINRYTLIEQSLYLIAITASQFLEIYSNKRVNFLCQFNSGIFLRFMSIIYFLSIAQNRQNFEHNRPGSNSNIIKHAYIYIMLCFWGPLKFDSPRALKSLRLALHVRDKEYPFINILH